MEQNKLIFMRIIISHKILMNVCLVTEDVNRTVIILLVATIVHVTIVIHSILIIIIVMVSTI